MVVGVLLSMGCPIVHSRVVDVKLVLRATRVSLRAIVIGSEGISTTTQVQNNVIAHELAPLLLGTASTASTNRLNAAAMDTYHWGITGLPSHPYAWNQ